MHFWQIQAKMTSINSSSCSCSVTALNNGESYAVGADKWGKSGKLYGRVKIWYHIWQDTHLSQNQAKMTR